MKSMMLTAALVATTCGIGAAAADGIPGMRGHDPHVDRGGAGCRHEDAMAARDDVVIRPTTYDTKLSR